MTKQKIKFTESDSSGPAKPGSSVEEVRDRLAGLLPGEALQDALEGLRPEQITGPGGLLTQLAGRVIETALSAELSEHLGYPPGQAPPGGAGNQRNGSTPKTLKTELGEVAVRTPRDRKGTFDPKLVAKRPDQTTTASATPAGRAAPFAWKEQPFPRRASAPVPGCCCLTAIARCADCGPRAALLLIVRTSSDRGR